MPSSPPAGLAGLVGFARSLRSSWRGFLLRAGILFVVLALAWMALAPLYARLFAVLASPFIPSIESSPGTRYLVEETRIIAIRPLTIRTIKTATAGRAVLRETSADYPLALLAALVLATPGWSLKRRGRILVLTLGLLILTQFLSFLVNIEYTKLWPARTAGGIVVSSDFSKTKMILFDWLFAFTEFMGRGFFALLLYFGAIALVWGRPEPELLKSSVGRNEPCPCGSGLKVKRCCGGVRGH